MMDDAARQARALSALVAVGLDAASIGPYDLLMKRERMASYLAGAARLGLPLLSSNLACDRKLAAKDPRCVPLAKTPRYRILRRGPLTIAVLSLLRADQATRLPSTLRGALSVSDPLVTARADIRALRTRQGVDLVIALGELDLENTAPRAASELVQRLGADAPDIVVSGQMFERGQQDFTFVLRRGSGRVIVGTDRFGQHLGELHIAFERRDDDVATGARTRYRVEATRARRLRPAHAKPQAQLAATARTFMREFCRDEDRPLGPDTRIEPPMVYADFVTFAAELMRRALGAEIALLDQAAIADTTFPLGGVLSRSKLLRVVRTRSLLGTFRVSGEKLVALLKTHAADNESALHVVGLRKDGDKWLVNERAVVEGQSYSVATTSFVATGGDSLIDTTGISFSRSDKTLFSLLASYFSKRRLKGNIALHQEFSAPANRILLAGSARLTTSLALSAIGNGASSTRYSRPLLRRDSVTTLAVELALFGSASTVDHSVEVDVQIQYGRTWTTAQGSQETIVAEAQDRFASNLLYRFSRLRNRFGKRWFVPEPYAELNLISELTPSGTYVDSAGVTQTYHLLDLAAAVGLGLQLHPMLFAKVGFVVRGEALTPTAADPDLPARPGLYLGYTLRRLKLLQDSATPIELESRLDLVMTELASDVRRDLTWQNQLSIALFDYVKLSVSQRLYVFDTTLRDASVANDVMVGLSFGVDRRLQTY